MNTTTTPDQATPDQRGRQADVPQEIPPRGWLDVLSRVRLKAKQDQVPLLAAGVAFYALLAIVPALIAVVSTYGLVADPAQVARQVRDLAGGLPASAQDLLIDQLDRVVRSSSTGLSIGAVAGLLVALWSASSGVRHLTEALNAAYGEDETRGVIRLRLASLAMTAGAIVFLAASVGLITGLPGLLDSAGLGDAARTVLQLLRWPLLAVMFLMALAALYRYGPDRDAPRWRWVTWGSGCATVGWLFGSIAFAVYSDRLSSFNETYGTLAGVVVLMLWLLLSATVVILGAEIDAEIERQTVRDTTMYRPRSSGLPADAPG